MLFISLYVACALYTVMTAEVKKARSGKKVGALVAGLSILRYMVKAPSPVGVSQVARDLGISPSTCFNLLRTLVLEDLIEFDSQSKLYTISYGLLGLTEGLNDRDRIVPFLRAKLLKIAVSNRVTVTLWRRAGEDRAVLVDRADADSTVRIHMHIGQRMPIFIGAMGRCLASHSGMSKDAIRRKFDALRWENPPKFEEYWADIDEARVCGYAVDLVHFVRGITTVSVPVFNSTGQVSLFVSAVGFSGQFSEVSLQVLAEDLLQVSRAGTKWLGGISNE